MPVTGTDRARVDAWCWAVRLFPSRSAATAAVRVGQVRVNGERVKPAAIVMPGDVVQIRTSGHQRVVVVQRLLNKRVGAPVAVTCYLDQTPPSDPGQGQRDRGAGRPTKRERRTTEKFLGRTIR